MKHIPITVLLFISLTVRQGAAQTPAETVPAKAAANIGETLVNKKVGDRELKLFVEKPADCRSPVPRNVLEAMMSYANIGNRVE